MLGFFDLNVYVIKPAIKLTMNDMQLRSLDFSICAMFFSWSKVNDLHQLKTGLYLVTGKATSYVALTTVT